MAMNGQEGKYSSTNSSSAMLGTDDGGASGAAKPLSIKRMGLTSAIGLGSSASLRGTTPGMTNLTKPSTHFMRAVVGRTSATTRADGSAATAPNPPVALQIDMDQDNEAAQQAALYAELHRKAAEEDSIAQAGVHSENAESGNEAGDSNAPPASDDVLASTFGNHTVSTAAMNRLKMTAEEQIVHMPPGLSTLYEGTCAIMQPTKGFGFITPDLGGPDIYFTRESVVLTFTRLVLLCHYVQHNIPIPPQLMEGVTPPSTATKTSSAPPVEREEGDKKLTAKEQQKAERMEDRTAANEEANETEENLSMDPISGQAFKSRESTEIGKENNNNINNGEESSENEEQQSSSEAGSPVDIVEKLRMACPAWFSNVSSSSMLGTPSLFPPLPPVTKASLETAWMIGSRLSAGSAALLQIQLDIGVPAVYHQQRLTFSVHRNRVAQGVRRLLRAEQVRGLSEYHYATPEEQAWFCEAFPHAIGHKHYESAPTGDHHPNGSEGGNGNAKNEEEEESMRQNGVARASSLSAPSSMNANETDPLSRYKNDNIITATGNTERKRDTVEAETTSSANRTGEAPDGAVAAMSPESSDGATHSKQPSCRMLERYLGYIRTYNPETRKGYIACDPQEAAFVLRTAVPVGGEADPSSFSSTPSDVMFFSGSVLFDPAFSRRSPEEGLKVRYSVADRGRHNKYIATLITGMDDLPLSEQNYIFADESERLALSSVYANQSSLAGNRRRGGLEDHGGNPQNSYQRNRHRRGGANASADGDAQQGPGSSGAGGGSVHKSAAAALQENYVGGEEEEGSSSSYHNHHGKTRKRGRALLTEDGMVEGADNAADHMMHGGHSHSNGTDYGHGGGGGTGGGAGSGVVGGNNPGGVSGKEGIGEEREEDPILFMDDYEFT